jgi:DNA primase
MTPLEQIKAKIDIVELIGETVKLKRSGRSYSGLCPFHSEKTPSFHVFPESQNWHCFGACSTGGDIFNFIMKRDRVEFVEALQILAQRAGVQLAARTPKDAAEDDRIKRLREINDATARYWHNLLINSPAAKEVREYLDRRAITQQSIVNFQLGYAPDSWDALGKYLLSRGYQPRDIFDAGLSTERGADAGGGYYDRFRNRLIFPIRDIKGQTVGFGARALDDSPPKYLNSPQTALFDKSAILYAIDMAKDDIRSQGAAVIVEGYVDALMAHQKGFKNVVASMGTALTDTQLKTLQRLTKKFILALDADAAGLEAMRRGLSVAQNVLAKEYVPSPISRNLIDFESRLQAEIKVAVLPAGFDPDDLLREDPSAWQTMLDTALPVVDYLIQIVTAPLDLSSARGKAEAAQTLMPLIHEMSDGVARSHYVQALARRLRVDERTLLDVSRPAAALTPVSRRPGRLETGASPPEKLAFGPEEYCLAMCLRHPDELPGLERLGLQPEDFVNTENRQLFGILKTWNEIHVDSSESIPAMSRESVPDALMTRYEELLETSLWYEPIIAEELEKSALRLRKRGLHRQIEQLRFLEEEARRAEALEEMQEFRQHIALLTEQLNWTQDAVDARSSGRLTAARLQRDKAASNENTV